MIADARFERQPKHFWAHVRSISQHLGYTRRVPRAKNVKSKQHSRVKRGPIKVPTAEEIVAALEDLGLSTGHLVDDEGQPSSFGQLLGDYYTHRAEVLDNFVEPRLMDAKRARKAFERLRRELCPCCPLPMNKQKGDKRAPAYFTGIINILIEAHAQGLPCDYGPLELTTVTRKGVPVRTLARRVDGAFPSVVNPIAIWEVKEYYYTTTFGSRVADGVYETLLDGMELEELRDKEGIRVRHYLMVDDHFTWWGCGRSYLCRLIDMLHMGYVDEILFGYEVVERMPTIVAEWVQLYKAT
jgi:GNAT superfamily N-acetyltransferase